MDENTGCDYEPITKGLRNAVGNANDMVTYVAIDSHDFDNLCDNIDAIHRSLEREHEILREQIKDVPKLADFRFVECKFTVEKNERVNGIGNSKRVTFEGYASSELYASIIDAVRQVVE